MFELQMLCLALFAVAAIVLPFHVDAKPAEAHFLIIFGCVTLGLIAGVLLVGARP